MNKKKFMEWLNYQYPSTKGNLEISEKIAQLIKQANSEQKKEDSKKFIEYLESKDFRNGIMKTLDKIRI